MTILHDLAFFGAAPANSHGHSGRLHTGSGLRFSFHPHRTSAHFSLGSTLASSISSPRGRTSTRYTTLSLASTNHLRNQAWARHSRRGNGKEGRAAMLLLNLSMLSLLPLLFDSIHSKSAYGYSRGMVTAAAPEPSGSEPPPPPPSRSSVASRRSARGDETSNSRAPFQMRDARPRLSTGFESDEQAEQPGPSISTGVLKLGQQSSQDLDNPSRLRLDGRTERTASPPSPKSVLDEAGATLARLLVKHRHLDNPISREAFSQAVQLARLAQERLTSSAHNGSRTAFLKQKHADLFLRAWTVSKGCSSPSLHPTSDDKKGVDAAADAIDFSPVDSDNLKDFVQLVYDAGGELSASSCGSLLRLALASRDVHLAALSWLLFVRNTPGAPSSKSNSTYYLRATLQRICAAIVETLAQGPSSTRGRESLEAYQAIFDAFVGGKVADTAYYHSIIQMMVAFPVPATLPNTQDLADHGFAVERTQLFRRTHKALQSLIEQLLANQAAEYPHSRIVYAPEERAWFLRLQKEDESAGSGRTQCPSLDSDHQQQLRDDVVALENLLRYAYVHLDSDGIGSALFNTCIQPHLTRLAAGKQRANTAISEHAHLEELSRMSTLHLDRLAAARRTHEAESLCGLWLSVAESNQSQHAQPRRGILDVLSNIPVGIATQIIAFETARGNFDNVLPLAGRLLEARRLSLSKPARTEPGHPGTTEVPEDDIDVGHWLSTPYFIVALLNAAQKAGNIGLCETLWAAAREEEERRGWILDVEAYTIMLRLYAEEAKREVANVQASRRLACSDDSDDSGYASVPPKRFSSSASTRMARQMSLAAGHSPASDLSWHIYTGYRSAHPSKAPDHRFFTQALKIARRAHAFRQAKLGSRMLRRARPSREAERLSIVMRDVLDAGLALPDSVMGQARPARRGLYSDVLDAREVRPGGSGAKRRSPLQTWINSGAEGGALPSFG